MDFYKKWMSYISDDARLVEIVMPGAHNAGSYGLPRLSCCQDGDLKQQAEYGVRHFCIRYDTDKRGTPVLCHGVAQGAPLENAFACIASFLTENPSEFLILDLREYYPQTILGKRFCYDACPEKVDVLVEKYLKPAEWALTEFERFGDVTMGDVRKAGKRYVLVNYLPAYRYSVDVPSILPWDKKLFGMRSDSFAKHCTELFDTCSTEGIYWFQTQQTAGFGTEVGFLASPRDMNEQTEKHFSTIIDCIRATPNYLRQANVIGGDFMTESYEKARLIISLNLDKHTVKADCVDAVKTAIYGK